MTGISEPIDPAIEIRVLEKTLAASREQARIARSEGLEFEIVRHWSAVSGWLRSRIRKLEAGDEPDWPDSIRFTGEAAEAS